MKPSTQCYSREAGKFRLSNGWRSFNGKAFLLLACLGISVAQCCFADTELLTNAVQVLSLSGDQAAEQLPVHIQGVVTAAEPDWAGRFFVQDKTSGVFVELISTNHPEPGDVVSVTGVTLPGAYAPIITKPVWKTIGHAPLPAAREVSVGRIMSGIEDGQRVAVAGVVHAVTHDPAVATNWLVTMTSGGYHFPVITPLPAAIDPAGLIGARVRVRGTVAATFNATLRHMIEATLYVPRPADFIITELEPVNPFDQPAVPLNAIAQYQRNRLPGQRVHVRGVVTLQRPSEDFFIEDMTGGLQVKSRQAQSLKVGDVVDAVGFPAFENYLPVLEDAVFRRAGKARVPVQAKVVSMKEIQAGLHHADLVALTAKLLNRNIEPGQLFSHRSWTHTTLLLQDENQPFTAVAETPHGVTTLADIPIGSTLQLTGVCFTETDADQRLKSLQILLPGADSVRVLARPSWFTPKRLFIGLGILFSVLLVAAIWTVMVVRRNLALGRLIVENKQAQGDLQQAHDQLEQRVAERTAQLKFQVTARQEAEVQFNATLQERTRLAQELHDTLEQTLTGIALQLDTTSKLFQNKPETANHHLELARDQVNQSQVEVRRSIWNLRSRALEQFDLPGALIASSQQLTEGSGVQVHLTTTGRIQPLPEIVEDNLLRIGQEAITNVIKHAQATLANIQLDYSLEMVTLQIRDNGCGFDPSTCAGPNEGHFGLLGIRERAKRLNANLAIQREKDETMLMVQVHLEEQSQPAVVNDISTAL